MTSLKIKEPGLNVLPPGVERYVVNGGGLTGIQILPEDEIEIVNNEGNQICEIAVFNKDGKSEVGILNLKENKTDQKPDNILQRGVLLSSGMIAGESLMGILLAFLAGAGIKSLNLGIDPNLVTALTMLAALGTIWWLYKSSK